MPREIERENTRFVSFLLYKSLLVCSEHEKHRLLIFNYWRSGIIQYIQSEIYNNLKCLFRHHQLYICIFPSHISIMNCVWSLIFFKMSLFSPNLIEIRFWAKKKIILTIFHYSETYLSRTLSKPKTCLNQTDFTVLYTEPWVNQKPV